ncbi:claudin-4-like [Nothobranchius furzeri]|uniref:Claudin-4-like n=1 Tax=Nothobranchius furzeri TaxID=105023 RepID=A0A9D2YF72_NOTFU|nr:claudin-4-like [Nothobranchius furzeri]
MNPKRALQPQRSTLFKSECHSSSWDRKNLVRQEELTRRHLLPILRPTDERAVSLGNLQLSRNVSLLFGMGKIAKETAGQVISFIGLVLAAVCCGVPMWRMTTYIGANIVTGQLVWDGLWMNCIMQSTGQMQCNLINSVMTLTQDLRAAQALVIICLVIGFIGFIITFIGAKCTTCLKSEQSSANIVISGGCLLIIAAVLILIPCCWSAAVTISDYDSSVVTSTQKRELGASIYIGWTAACLLLIGGITLTTSCPPQQSMYPQYPPAPMYRYAPATYGPTYVPPSNRSYTPAGSYMPSKPYAAPATYSPRQYI